MSARRRSPRKILRSKAVREIRNIQIKMLGYEAVAVPVARRIAFHPDIDASLDLTVRRLASMHEFEPTPLTLRRKIIRDHIRAAKGLLRWRRRFSAQPEIVVMREAA